MKLSVLNIFVCLLATSLSAQELHVFKKPFITTIDIGCYVKDSLGKSPKTIVQVASGDTIEVMGFKGFDYLIQVKGTRGWVDIVNILRTTEINDALEAIEKAQREKRYKENEEHNKELIHKYGKKIGQKIFNHEIWIGMTQEMVEDSWYNPYDRSRRVEAWGVFEVWEYKKYQKLYSLHFHNGKLVSWKEL